MPKKSDQGKRKGSDLMNQLGFGAMAGVPGMTTMNYDHDDDEDLEAELAALAGEDYKPPTRKAKPVKKGPLALSEIERMAAAGMQDIDDDVSDTEDPDLLAELAELEGADDDVEEPSPTKQPNSSVPAIPSFQTSVSPGPAPQVPSRKAPSPSPRPLPAPRAAPTPRVTSGRSLPSSASPASQQSPKVSGTTGLVAVLEERVTMYKEAMAKAKAVGDGSKHRRMDRGLKTLMGMLRQAKAGKPVNEEEIPPVVFTGSSTVASTPSQTSAPVDVAITEPTVTPQGYPAPAVATFQASEIESTKLSLSSRRDEYKRAALMAKRDGDLAKAGHYVKIAKQFDSVMEGLEQGRPVDLSKMPPAPPESSVGDKTYPISQPVTAAVSQSLTPSGSTSKEEKEPESHQSSLDEARALFGAPESPSSVMEALTQRLAKYKEAMVTAKAAGDGSKTRRMGRIVKQFEDAIKCVKAGKPVDFDELPTPPGFGPIPNSASQGPATSQHPPASSRQADDPIPPAPAATAKPAPTTRPPPTGMPVQAAAQAGRGRAQPVQRQNTGRKSTSRIDQQMTFLKERMGEFKDAAMKAKKNQDIELAKKYVRMMKGIEPMIEALESGLPVDLSQVPPSPMESEETDFIVVNAEDCTPTGDRQEVFKTLQEDLARQIRVSVTNAQHYQKLGDVPATSKFQKLEQNSRKDLESLKSAFRHGDPAPRFHYETRTFSMVQSNTDLGDADMEVTVERGIQYNLPSGYSEKDMDTCVKYEMAYPNENPQTGSTSTVKDTVNPEYDETFKLEINRTSKSFFRFVERKALKFEIYIKRGFFKGDKLLGTVNVKLQPLENKCTLHNSYDLMDGRKAAGGKLEVKIRIRDPFKSKQVEEVKEKWLVIDQFIRTAGSKSEMDTKASKSESIGTISMEVMRFEKQTLEKQIGQLKDSLSVTQTQSLRQKSALIQEKIELQQKRLREGGLEAWTAYLASVEKEAAVFSQEARHQVRLGETKKAELYLTKKKHVEKEIAAIKTKLSPSQ